MSQYAALRVRRRGFEVPTVSKKTKGIGSVKIKRGPRSKGGIPEGK